MSAPLPVGFGVSAVPLARRNIFANKFRLIRSASGIAFSAFLMLVQLGFQTTFTESTLELIRRFDADLVVTSAVKYQLSRKSPFTRRALYQARAVPGVETARPVYGEWTRSTWQNSADGKRYFIQALAFDPDEPVFLIPEVTAKLAELRLPDTVMMDTRSRRFLGAARIGLETELARKQVKIIGNFSMGPDFFTDGTVITSDRNFAKLFPTKGPSSEPRTNDLTERPDVEFVFVKVKPGEDVATMQQRLTAALPSDLVVLTRQQLMDKEAIFQSKFSAAGPIFGLGVLIGFAVGMIIAYQILHNDIFDQLPQYATLKAMGYGNGYLVTVVLQQAIFYGLVGYIPAVLMCIGVFEILEEIVLLKAGLSAGTIALGAALTIGMCMLSGLIAVRRVIQADAAEVF